MKLRQLAPTWCKAFDQWHRLNAHEREAIKYDLRLQTRCVVAEAWGWNDIYIKDCPECDWFGFSFLCCVNGPENMLDHQLLDVKGREFSRHWMKEHLGFGLSLGGSLVVKTKRHILTKKRKNKTKRTRR